MTDTSDAATTTVGRSPAPESGGALARRTTLGVVVAIAAVVLVQALVDALRIDVGAAGAMSPFATGPLIGTTIVAGVGAALVYTTLVTVTDQPRRNFVAVSVVVFALMLLPVVLVVPSMGITPTGQGILVLYHVLVAVPVVAFVLGSAEG